MTQMKPETAEEKRERRKPQILSAYKYRGFLVRELFNRKTKRAEFRCRFQINNKEFNLTNDKKADLEEMIDEVYYQERRIKATLPVPQVLPGLKELFDAHKPRISKENQRKLFERVSKTLLKLLPAGIKITDLKRAHFQKYIDFRSKQSSQKTGRRVLEETIDKELYSISSALRNAPRLFVELEDYQKPVIPKAAEDIKKRRRTRLVQKTGELDRLLAELRKPKSGKQTEYHAEMRRRLADDLEFRYETGLRRKESAKLKKNQYRADEGALRDVIRWKTGTVTPFFPLSQRGVELVEKRLTESDSEYIFTEDGNVVASEHRTIKELCAKLGIPYGQFTDGGFVPHDLRHNFASEIVRVTDIETAKSLTGHTGNAIFTYLHTDENLQREAVRKREGRDRKKEIVEIYKQVKRGKIKLRSFVEKVKKLTEK